MERGWMGGVEVELTVDVGSLLAHHRVAVIGGEEAPWSISLVQWTPTTASLQTPQLVKEGNHHHHQNV